jgi:hypothetical protein
LDKNLKHSFILKEKALKACLEQRKTYKLEEKNKIDIDIRKIRKERKYTIHETLWTDLDEISLDDNKDVLDPDDYSSSSFSAFSDTDSYDDDSFLDEKK